MLLLTEHLIRYTNAYLTKKSCLNDSKSLNNGFIFRFNTPPKNCMIREKNLKMIFLRTSQTYLEYRTCAPPYKTVNKMILQKKNEQNVSVKLFYKSSWKNHLSKVIHVYNSTGHNTAEYSSFYLVFGRKLQLPIDLTPQAEKYSQPRFNHT